MFLTTDKYLLDQILKEFLKCSNNTLRMEMYLRKSETIWSIYIVLNSTWMKQLQSFRIQEYLSKENHLSRKMTCNLQLL